MAKSTAKHFKLMRDDARPIEFDGTELASVEFNDMATRRTRAAVYRTVGGRFVAEYTKSSRYTLSGEGESWQVDRAKVAHFNSLEDAAAWFRPGPVTTALLAKLQDQLTGEQID